MIPANKIPVSYDFFKKYTYHEEWIDIIFKHKAKGNQQMYQAMLQSDVCKERALRSYYESFYLNPKIREKYHIRLKAMPKKIKEKLLQIPVQDTGRNMETNKKNLVDCRTQQLNEDNGGNTCNKQNNELEKVSSMNADKTLDRQRQLLMAADADDQIVEDDSEPMSSPGRVTSYNQPTVEMNPSRKQSNVEAFTSSSKVAKVGTEENSEIKNSEHSEDMLKQKERENQPQTATGKKSSVNYTDLMPYIHCCPLKYKEFRKYSNIDQLIRDFCEKKHLDKNEQRKILNRSYILFYLAPEHRTTKPINKIQLVDNCPIYIKNKFFDIPKNLYLKEESTKTALRVEHFSHNTTEVIHSLEQTTSEMNTNIAAIQEPTIPVSLEEFKKYTNYEDVIDKIFKTVTQDNEQLYNKYKNCKEAFDGTLINYHRAFYLSPTVRETFPICFKPVPKSLREHLLQIPNSVNVTSALRSCNVDQLIYTPFSISITEDKQVTNNDNNGNICSVKVKDLPLTENAVEESVLTRETQAVDDNTKPFTPSAIKRETSDDVHLPSPKRLKSQQTENYTNNTEQIKKTYKDMLPYAHCCPVTFSEFKKYTNISELFRGYCQKRYNSVRKLPYMLKRAYVLHYLAPENRKYKPFNKLQVSDNCPMRLRDKIFEIPTKLYLKNAMPDIMETEKNITANEPANLKGDMSPEQQQIDQPPRNAQLNRSLTNNGKPTIKILENRLLPPSTLNLSSHSDVGSLSNLQCTNTDCVFHHITHYDFMKHTNILHVVPQPHVTSVIKQLFKKFVHKIIMENNCDDLYVHTALLCKLLKHQHICDDCDQDISSLLNAETATTSTKTMERTHNATDHKTDLERSGVNFDRSTNNQTRSCNNITDNSKVSTDAELKRQPTELLKHLKSQTIFKKFRKKLLSKLNYSFNIAVDFSSDTYKIFLQCNEIPLKDILNDFCEQNNELVELILNDDELCIELQRYYYCKYLTNPSFALKYPAILKQYHTESSTNEVDKVTPVGSRQQELNAHNATQTQDMVTKENKLMEKAKRIFFRNVDKTNTLSYVIRTSFGLKQLILRTIMTLSFDDFLHLTHVYEGKAMFADKHLAECMYRYVFQSPIVWPTNLFVTLSALCEFLHTKHIRFNTNSMLLTHISPKLLHWSDLRLCTNIIECVKIDYERRTGNLLDTNDDVMVERECDEYYNRCWKYEKWLGQVPLLNEEFCATYLRNYTQDKVGLLDATELEEITAVPTETTANVVSEMELGEVSSQAHPTQTKESNLYRNSAAEKVPDISSEVNIQTSNNMPSNAEHAVKEFNCILLPNTQQQIEMLPAEERLSIDPLNNSNNNIGLNVIASTCESPDFVILSPIKQSVPIKSESIASKLLNNLFFYEDDDSNMQCTPLEQEIVSLDDSVSQPCQNLPPSQISFNGTSSQQILSGDLVNTEGGSQLINLSQRLPSSIESNGTLCNPQNMQQHQQNKPTASTQLMQLPDVSLRSSGDNEQPNKTITATQLLQLPDVSLRSSGDSANQEQELETRKPLNKHDVEQHLEMLINENENVIIYNSPNTMEELTNILQQLQTPVEITTTSVENTTTYLETQRFRNTSEIAQPLDVGNISTSTNSTDVAQNQIKNKNVTPTTQPQNAQQGIVNTSLHPQKSLPQKDATNSKIVTTVVQPVNTETSTNSNTASSTRRAATKTYVPVKNTKNVAKVRPLKNSELVPQIQHNARPLLTKPLHVPGVTKTNKEPVQQLMAARVSSEQNSNLATTSTQISQNRMPSLDTHIHISQELNTNCSVFNNSSLLRIVDHNYHQQQRPDAQTKSKEAQKVFAGNSKSSPNSKSQQSTEQQPQQQQQHQQQKPSTATAVGHTDRQSMLCRNSMCTENNTQVNNTQRPSTTSTTLVIPKASIGTASSNYCLYKDSKNKVNSNNNITTLIETNNLVATVAPTIHPTFEVIRIPCLYRDLIKFHYFKELKPQHITEYMLPSLEIGKSYAEATVVCDSFKTRISNRSIASIFSFWPPSLQRDFLLVLNDLKEFHYEAFDRRPLKEHEDLRVRILFWLLNTTPSFALCQFVFETNNKEFARCESIRNGNNPSYMRKPFTSLKNAFSSKILTKLKHLKRDLK